ncbi:hypothetical protein ACQP2E_00690 [Actinoplanes sp. CA-015351]|uniref:hypothetical protein n=1 Tax=Actinoplanes sp. CA-015351 TaxID=3239897 RepID=UPI003D9670A1
MSRRFIAFATTSLLASGAVVGLGAAPASAAVLQAGAMATAVGAPAVSSARYPDALTPHGGIALGGDFTMESAAGDAVQYVYHFTGPELGDSQPWFTRSPQTPGGPLTIEWTPFFSGVHELTVHSIDADGNQSETATFKFWVLDTRPTVTSTDYPGIFFHDLKFNVGVPGVFHIDGPAGAERLEWRFDDDGGLPGSVKPGANGDADVKITPTAGGIHLLWVRAVDTIDENEHKFPEHGYRFLVDNGPLVTGDFNHEKFLGDKISVHATPRVPGVKAYQYWTSVNSGDTTATITVPAKSDGSADLVFPVTDLNLNDIYVRTVGADGDLSVARRTSAFVSDRPKVVSSEFPEIGTVRLTPGTFTFTARRPGVTSFQYTLNGGPAVTVKPRTDGTAAITVTPSAAGTHQLVVRSFTGEVGSVDTWYFFKVAPAVVKVGSAGPASVTTGGVRTITVKGSNLHRKDVLQVTPAGGKAITATIKSVSADGTTAVADVNLAGSPVGVASVTLRPYGAGQAAVVLAKAFTIVLQAKPVATKRPAISGTVMVGKVVKAASGTWSPAATGYRYQWAANGVAIKGATGSSLTIPASVAGKRLTVTVTATRAGHQPGAAASAATAAVARAKAPKATKKPKITGTPKVGKKLTANVGTWSPKVDSYRYQWRVNGKVIKGAAGRTLKLKSAWRNKKITVTVIARKAGHVDGSAISASVKIR